MIDKSTLKKLAMFGLVGFTGMIIDYAATAFLKEVLEANKYLANTTGFVLAASSNYFINRKWTFKSSNPKIGKEYTGFIAIAIVGLLLNNSIIWILSDYLFSLNFYLSKFVAISIVFIWNFVMNNFFNFKHRKT